MKILIPILLFGLIVIGSAVPVHAQAAPVVQIVFFFNPDCENCHLVITRDLPPLQAQYGAQLEILQIDTSKPDGIRLYQAMTSYFQLTKDRLGTPAIVVGTTVLVGADEIPTKLPGLIAENMAKGGLGWPAIPGLSPFVAALGKSNPYPQPASQLYPQPVDQNTTTSQSENTSILARFRMNFEKDVTANSLAVSILIGMLISMVAIITIIVRNILADNPNPVFLKIPGWVIPLLIVLGIGIAAYLTFIEVGKKPAICGPVGHCNEVQNSPYAKLFGILPVGVLGLIGYVGILIAWGTKLFGPKALRTMSTMAIWGMALFGVAFSIYLTFLEPFVIGAACIWCLSSAVVMTTLFWVATPGLQEMLVLDEDADDDQMDLPSGASG